MSYRKGLFLTFGAVNAVVDLDNAIASEEGLKNVCLGPTGTEHQPTALKQSLKCPATYVDGVATKVCENEDKTTFKKARVNGKLFTVVDPEEIAQAKADSVGATKDVINLQVHPAEEVHTQSIPGGSTYQLKASGPHMSASVALFVDMIRRHPELAFTALYAPAGRTNFYELSLFGDVLVMSERVRTENMKIIQVPVDPIAADYQKMVDQLLGIAVVSYDPVNYQDAYLAKVADILATKTAQDGVPSIASPSTAAAAKPGTLDQGAMLAEALRQMQATVAPKAAPRKKAAPKQKPQVA
jgi:non-homologous end joining protein Ku